MADAREDRVRVLVVHPPVSVAKDFIDYPYFSNLGAVQLAAVLRAKGFEVALIDAFTCDVAPRHTPPPELPQVGSAL